MTTPVRSRPDRAAARRRSAPPHAATGTYGAPPAPPAVVWPVPPGCLLTCLMPPPCVAMRTPGHALLVWLPPQPPWLCVRVYLPAPQASGLPVEDEDASPGLDHMADHTQSHGSHGSPEDSLPPAQPQTARNPSCEAGVQCGPSGDGESLRQTLHGVAVQLWQARQQAQAARQEVEAARASAAMDLESAADAFCVRLREQVHACLVCACLWSFCVPSSLCGLLHQTLFCWRSCLVL